MLPKIPHFKGTVSLLFQGELDDIIGEADEAADVAKAAARAAAEAADEAGREAAETTANEARTET